MIVAFGCSITHGCELVHPYQHEDNTINSYPQLVANQIGSSCINYGLCGISNEGIFHMILNKVSQHKDVNTIIVGWTASMREYWFANGRHWFVIPSWTATMEDVEKQPTEIKDYVKDYSKGRNSQIITDHRPRMVSDNKDYLEELELGYNFLTKNKFDEEEYKIKKKHYIESTRLYCQSKNIKLIETTSLESVDDISIFIDNIGKWREGINHPSNFEHQLIAKRIIEQYYE